MKLLLNKKHIMTTIQDRIIKDFKEKFDKVQYCNNGINLVDMKYLEQFLINSIKEVEEETRKVCDICFRDIKAWNKKVEEEKTKKIKNLMKQK